MKILISTVYPSSWPYIDQLCKHLLLQGHTVDILDVEGLNFFTYSQPIKGSKSASRHKLDRLNKLVSGRLVNKALRVTKMAGAARRAVQSMEVAVIKKLLQQGNAPYDLVNIHYILPVYTNRNLLALFDAVAKKKLVTVWGSDFYRTDEVSRQALTSVFDWADGINCTEKGVKDITGHYGRYHDKAFELVLGIDSLDEIREMKKEETAQSIKKKWNMPADKLVVTIGYNANNHQQHLAIIESVKALGKEALQKLFFVLPMTYAENEPGYRDKVAAALQDAGMEFLMFREFMDAEDVLRLRIMTDIALNMQKTDMMSSSIREHLYSGNIVITGKWLPYDVYDRIGVLNFRTGLDELTNVLRKVLADFDNIKANCEANGEKVYNIAAWPSLIGNWTAAYNRLLKA